MIARARLMLGASLPLLIWLPTGRSQTLVTMNWGVGAQSITGDSNVSTSGTLVQATNLGDFSGWTDRGPNYSTVLNGVTFNGVSVPSNVQSLTVGSFTLSESPNYLMSVGSTIPNEHFDAPAQNLSSAYRELLVSAATTESGGERTVTLTMPNLTINRVYQFQWWTAQPDSASAFLTTATGDLQLSSNTLGALGGLGQFAVGTFTASHTTMYIEFNGDGNSPVINAFQLRDLSAVPEPSTYALVAGLGALALAWVVRRRRA